MSKLRVVTFAILLLLVVAVGCSSSDQGAIDKAVKATLAAAQPATTAPTATVQPATATPTATFAPTPVPTGTPVPEPTDAPVPTLGNTALQGANAPQQNGEAPDLTAAARSLGITVKELREALGGQPPDFAAAAEVLGITLEELMRVVPPPPNGDLAGGSQGSASVAPPDTSKPDSSNMGEGDRPEDRYACHIDADGYCIFTGSPHKTGLKPGTDDIVDNEGVFLFFMEEAVAVNSSGQTLEARGRPAFDGDELIVSVKEGMTDDEQAFHKVMAIMFPIRNALMYDIADLSQDKWDELIVELSKRGIKETSFTSGATPKENYYGRQGIFDLAKPPNGKDIHHSVMKFLEESGLYLLCHVTSDEFHQTLRETHPEGHDPCVDAAITTKIRFQ